MTDDPTTRQPTPDPGPVAPRPVRVGPRDVALAAIVFVAVLALLLGVTRIIDRGVAAEPTSSGGLMASPTPSGTSTSSPGPSSSTATGQSPSPTSSQVPDPTPAPAGDPVLVGAGDIGDCTEDDDDSTASLLDGIAGTVFTLGDNAYRNGTPKQFRECYHPNWGRHLARTRPSAGNHDWGRGNLDGYFGYFGANARGPGGASWYSYDLGTWHVIVLDSSCDEVGGCDAGSRQVEWLEADLAASDARCTVAYWHHPRFSSGYHGNSGSMRTFWERLYEADADVILSGHDHSYERFAPQDPDSDPDPERGMREFVVGTGGTELRAFKEPEPNSELRVTGVHGVLALTLRDGSYEWEFIATAGSDFSDRGTAPCH